MNIVDMAILLIIAYFVYTGFIKGFIMTLYGMASIVLSWILTKRFYPVVEQLILRNNKLVSFIVKITGYGDAILSGASTKMIVTLISFVFTFLLSLLFLKAVALTINKLMDYPVIRTFNRVGGGILGAIEGFAFLFLLFGLLSVVNSMLPLNYWTYIEKSQFAKLFLTNKDIVKLLLL
ncbi:MULTISPECIES: CvpA family protein [Thermoanaerobacterium]|uniref:Colicin V production protein n=2 Tax=Thermoanaerobacterium TaxID=28895 RepID=W9EJ58_9THEO|nr:MULTISPECIES: CvpA family protein [Thermoanaerobacterium]AFK85559.1 Colicin V production protein [Thermoanaerobacterium saccharolyticum JW/SL-YS485]ETO39724.1 colicin V production protein [Thermoanaerobacterium aotearoense SCUT27]